MGVTVKLRHGKWTDYDALPARLEPFYDGEAIARNGIVEIPVERITWLQAAMMRGYNLTPSGERMWTLHDLQREIERQTIGETLEGSDTGGQSPS